MSDVKYKRILLKLSGEALAGDKKVGIDDDVVREITSKVKEVSDLGVEVAIVVVAASTFITPIPKIIVNNANK